MQPTTQYILRDPFHKRFRSSLFKSRKILIVLILPPIIEYGHNFAHAMTSLLSWHVQNGDQIGSLLFM